MKHEQKDVKILLQWLLSLFVTFYNY